MDSTALAPFITLGRLLLGVVSEEYKEIYASATRLREYIPLAARHNGWFDQNNVARAIGAIGQMLKEDALQQWAGRYAVPNKAPKRVGVLLAGNIPLAGFHDFLCVLVSGNIFIGKLSSKDEHLLPLVADLLKEIEPELARRCEFTKGPFDRVDAIIATGSNNTSNYLEYYFGKYPHIIRKNRNAVAVLDGSETEEDLVKLGEDIFNYYGLGCRSVSKIYVPEKYDLDHVFKGLYPYRDIVNHNKYGNNYDYHKAIYLMNKKKLTENGFILLTEDRQIASPVAVLHYEYYVDSAALSSLLEQSNELIQCVLAKKQYGKLRTVGFGQAQQPAVGDYADGVDTMEFLMDL